MLVGRSSAGMIDPAGMYAWPCYYRVLLCYIFNTTNERLNWTWLLQPQKLLITVILLA